MRVLVVDDRAVDRRLVRVLLEAAGHEVDEAPDGRAALDQLRDAAYDAVVSDVKMPYVDGFALAAALRGPGQPKVVLLSGTYDEPWDVEVAREVGAAALLPKPVSAAKLLEALAPATEASP